MGSKRLPAPEKRCQMRRENGKRCRAARLRDSDYCLWHHPWVERHRAAWKSILEMPMRESSEVHALLVESVKGVQKGKLGPQQAYAIGWLVRQLRENLPAVEKELAEHEKEATVGSGEPEYSDEKEEAKEAG